MVEKKTDLSALGEYQTLLSYRPHTKQLVFHLLDNKIKAFVGGERPLAYGTLVYMANGAKKKIEDLKIGDRIIGWADGKTFSVKIGDISFDGEEECYEIEFLDGNKITSSIDHEFPSYLNRFRYIQNTWDTFSVATIEEAKWPLKRLIGGGCLNFSKNGNHKIPFSGLLLGLYLGDGSSSQPPSSLNKRNGSKTPNFTNHDEEIKLLFLKELKLSFPHLICKTFPSDPYRLHILGGYDNPFSQALRRDDIRLWNKRAHQKFIPTVFKRASIEDRKGIIIGLILTDGWKDRKTFNIQSCSLRMLEDAQEILLSLGCAPGSIHKRGFRSKKWNESWVLKIPLNAIYQLGINDFLLHKKHKDKFSTKKVQERHLIIKSIKSVGKRKVRCVSLDSEVTRFFVLDGNIVTSNSGKSTATSYEAVWLSLGIHPFWKDAPLPPVKIRIVGPDHSTVIDKVNLPTIMSILPKDSAYFWKERRVLEFFNGSEIYFQSNEQDIEKFGGMSLHMVIEDEEPRQDIHNENLMRLIDTGGKLLMSYTPMTGLSWSYNDIFLNEDRDDDGKLLVGKVFCKTIENPYISEKEIDLIKKIYKDEEEIEAHLEGSYFSRSGLIIKEFDRSKHVVEPRDPNTYGMIIIGIDHHQRNPEAVVFCSVDSDNNIHVFDEIYEEGLVRDTALLIGKKLDGKKPAYTIIDSNAATPNAITGDSAQREYAKYGIHTLVAKKGHGSVNEGLDVLREYFRDNKITISRKCNHLISQLSSYIWDDWASRVRSRKNLKEVPMKKFDHLIDGFRYLVHSRPKYRSVDTIKLPNRVPVSQITAY